MLQSEIQFEMIIYFPIIRKKLENLHKSFRRIKGQIFNFECEKIYQDLRKKITILAYFDSIFIRYKYFTCKLTE